MISAQAMAGNQGVLGPTKIYLAVQPAQPAQTTPAPAPTPESPSKAKVVVQQVSDHSTPVCTLKRKYDACYAPAKLHLILDDSHYPYWLSFLLAFSL